jgi:hypothetical protein
MIATLRVRLCLGIALLPIVQPLASAQTRVERQKHVNHNIRCVIQVERMEWNPVTTAVVTEKIENLSGVHSKYQ